VQTLVLALLVLLARRIRRERTPFIT
jgi:hypothetical protein